MRPQILLVFVVTISYLNLGSFSWATLFSLGEVPSSMPISHSSDTKPTIPLNLNPQIFLNSQTNSPEEGLDPNINYSSATWQDLVASAYSLTRAMGLALSDDPAYLQAYVDKLNVNFNTAPYEIFALVNNPHFYESKLGSTLFQELIKNGTLAVAILWNKFFSSVSLENLANQLPKDGPMRKALADSVFLQSATKKEIITQMLPFFDRSDGDTKTKSNIGATFAELDIISDSAVQLPEWDEAQLRNWLDKLTDVKEDTGIRKGAATLLAYVLNQEMDNPALVSGSSPLFEEIARRTWEGVFKDGSAGNANGSLRDMSWGIISGVMQDMVYATKSFKEELANNILAWITQGKFSDSSDKGNAISSLLGVVRDHRVSPGLKLQLLPHFQEFASDWFGQAGIMQVAADPNIPLGDKVSLIQDSLNVLQQNQNTGASLDDLLQKNKITEHNLSLLALVAAQSAQIKTKVTGLLRGLGGVSNSILEIWENYSVFVANNGRNFTDSELNTINPDFAIACFSDVKIVI